MFRWKHSNWIIAILFTACVSVMGMGVAIEGAGLLFGLAYFFIIGTFLWGLGCWLTSENVHKNNPQNWSRAKRKRATQSDTYRFYALKYGVSVAIISVLVLSVVFIRWVDEKHELSLLRGWLYPDNDPFPSTNVCSKVLSKNGLLVFFSPDWVGGGDRFPHTILRVKGKDIIFLDRRDDGSLGISLDVFGQDGTIIAKIEKGRFSVNQNNILEMIRTDRSSLRILDQTGTQILSIRYFNPQAIWVDAVLYYPGYPYRITLHGSDLEATNCAYNSGRADVNIE
jgi:hypothetical protein